MKKAIYTLFTIAGVVILSAAEYKSAGPPGCFAGEPPNNTNCTSCHSDYPVNTGSATILFDVGGADTGYAPGATYNITVSVKKPGMQAGGFQFIALQDNDIKTSPGIITLNDPARTQKVDPGNPHVQGCGLFNKVYIEHTYSGINSDVSGESLWSFKWKAPDTGVGNISFYLATVQSNYSGDEFGDYVYTRKITSIGPPNSIGSLNASLAKLKVYPNPTNGRFTIELPAQVKSGQAAISDMSGSIIRIVDFEKDTKLEIDLGSVSNGVYMVQILNSGNVYRALVTVQN